MPEPIPWGPSGRIALTNAAVYAVCYDLCYFTSHAASDCCEIPHGQHCAPVHRRMHGSEWRPRSQVQAAPPFPCVFYTMSM